MPEGDFCDLDVHPGEGVCRREILSQNIWHGAVRRPVALSPVVVQVGVVGSTSCAREAAGHSRPFFLEPTAHYSSMKPTSVHPTMQDVVDETGTAASLPKASPFKSMSSPVVVPGIDQARVVLMVGCKL